MEHSRTEDSFSIKPVRLGTTQPSPRRLGNVVCALPPVWWGCGSESWLHVASVRARGWDNAQFYCATPHGTPAPSTRPACVLRLMAHRNSLLFELGHRGPMMGARHERDPSRVGGLCDLRLHTIRDLTFILCAVNWPRGRDDRPGPI